MKKLRKANTAQRKADRKAAQEALENRTAAFLDHPKECCVCKETFHRTHDTVQTWQVTVVENRVRLTCPSCWGTIQEVLENHNV